MSALRLETPPARVRYSRTARIAAQKRAERNMRNRYATTWRILFGVTGALIVLLSYVLLTSNITATAYALERAQQQRSELQAQVARYDDEITSLTSDERLASVASKLGMVQPTEFLRISLVTPPAQSHPLAFLSR